MKSIVSCLALMVVVFVVETKGQCDTMMACFTAYTTTVEGLGASPAQADLCAAVSILHGCSKPHMSVCTDFAVGVNAIITTTGCTVCETNFDLYFIVDTSTIASATQFTDWIDFMKAVTGKLNLDEEKVGVVTFSGASAGHTVTLGDYTDLADLNTKIDALNTARTDTTSDIISMISYFNTETDANICPVMGFVLTWNAQGDSLELSIAARTVNSQMNKRLFSFIQLNFDPTNSEDRAYLQKIPTPGLAYTLFDYAGDYKKPIDTATHVVTALNFEAEEASMGIRHNPANPHP